MLRTRLETRVEDWVAHGSELADTSLNTQSPSLNPERLARLWNWAGPEANEIAQEQIFFHNYTAAEKEMGIENVVTGLKHQPVDDTEEGGSDEDEEGDEQDEDTDDQDKMEVDAGESSQGKSASKPAPTSAMAVEPIALDKILRFMTTGAMPVR